MVSRIEKNKLCHFGQSYQPTNATLESLDTLLNSLVNGYKKIVAEKKEKGIMSAVEGKSVITDAGYIELVKGCRDLHKNAGNVARSKASVFGWAWLTLQKCTKSKSRYYRKK